MDNTGLIITIVGVIFNAAMFAIIKFNDLKHLSSDVTEIKQDVKKNINNISHNAEKIAHIEGRLENVK